MTAPTQLAAAHFVQKIIVDVTDVYYLDVESASAGLYRIPKAGGRAVLLASVPPLQSGSNGWDFALDDRAAYLTFSHVGEANGVTLIDKASGASRFIAAEVHGCTVPIIEEVTAVGGSAWMMQHNVVPSGSSCTQSASTSIEVVPSGADHSTSVSTLGAYNWPILADGTHLFWSGDDGTYRELHDGSSPERLAPIGADNLVTDGNTLFANVGAHVFAITAPGQFAVIYSNDKPPFSAVSALAVDDTRVYIAGPPGLLEVDKSGGAPRTLVSTAATAVAVDATNVYYSNPDSVMTACK